MVRARTKETQKFSVNRERGNRGETRVACCITARWAAAASAAAPAAACCRRRPPPSAWGCRPARLVSHRSHELCLGAQGPSRQHRRRQRAVAGGPRGRGRRGAQRPPIGSLQHSMLTVSGSLASAGPAPLGVGCREGAGALLARGWRVQPLWQHVTRPAGAQCSFWRLPVLRSVAMLRLPSDRALLCSAATFSSPAIHLARSLQWPQPLGACFPSGAMGLATGQASDGSKTPFEVLETRWRRVASTHTLQVCCRQGLRRRRRTGRPAALFVPLPPN